MDDFEREMLILDLKDEAIELDREMLQKDKAKPEWWLIALGRKESTRQEWLKADEVYHQFLRFSFKNKGRSFEELVNLFTVAKMQNRLPEKARRKE